MSLWTKIKYLFFGEGGKNNERTSEPLKKSEIWLAYSGAVFLIAVAVYIPMSVFESRSYYHDRHQAVFEECVLSVKDFQWCWLNLTPSP